MARDDAQIVAAFVQLDQIRTDWWPLVASWLLASGVGGDSTLAMAVLDRGATAWDVEPLVPEVVREIGTPYVSNDEAALLLGATYASVEPQGGAHHTVIRVLAKAAPGLGYPAGWVAECYFAEEFVDCDCDSEGHDRADTLEHTLRTSVSVDGRKPVQRHWDRVRGKRSRRSAGHPHLLFDELCCEFK